MTYQPNETIPLLLVPKWNLILETEICSGVLRFHWKEETLTRKQLKEIPWGSKELYKEVYNILMDIVVAYENVINLTFEDIIDDFEIDFQQQVLHFYVAYVNQKHYLGEELYKRVLIKFTFCSIYHLLHILEEQVIPNLCDKKRELEFVNKETIRIENYIGSI